MTPPYQTQGSSGAPQNLGHDPAALQHSVARPATSVVGVNQQDTRRTERQIPAENSMIPGASQRRGRNGGLASRVRFSLDTPREERPPLEPRLSLDTSRNNSTVSGETSPVSELLSPHTRSMWHAIQSSLFRRGSSQDRSHGLDPSTPLDSSTTRQAGGDRDAELGLGEKAGADERKLDNAQAGSRYIGSSARGRSYTSTASGQQYGSTVQDREKSDLVIEEILRRRAKADNKAQSTVNRAGNLLAQVLLRNALARWTSQRFRNAREYVSSFSDIPPSEDGRHIPLDIASWHDGKHGKLKDPRRGGDYLGNTIRSSRYSIYSFLPRQLIAQFSKLANFYFLCVSILQMIPGLSTTGTFTTFAPLMFFVGISIAKEGYDDLRRYRLDKAENNQETLVLQLPSSTATEKHGIRAIDGESRLQWTSKKWMDLKVGEVVKLNRDDAAPADIVLLHSSGPRGIAYIETMALDGETNLKSRQAAPSFSKECKQLEDLPDQPATFVVEDPNQDLYNFEGKITVGDSTSPLTTGEVVLRGSVLRNTPNVAGLVVYTGEECKIRMNANKTPRTKAPALQSLVNKIVIIIVIFVILLSIGNTVAYQIWSSETEDKSWYLTNADVAFFPIFASFIIMFNTLIPLSLYVSLEIVKIFQIFFLDDIDMYDEVSNTPFEPRTSTINEELGQISYIFSDKTGTLTDNIMKFRKISVAGTSWLHDIDLEASEDRQLMHKRRKTKKKARSKSRLSKSFDLSRLSGDVERFPAAVAEDNEQPLTRTSVSRWRGNPSQLELSTSDLVSYLTQKPSTAFAQKAKLFLLSLALCHTCLPEENEGAIDYQASSPDELALVRAAKEMGFIFYNRDANLLKIRTFPNGLKAAPVEEDYTILDVVEFSSKRKRMSVVVRFPDGRICVVCKGADSVVMQRLRLADLANQKAIEVERLANRRKSMEASKARQRRSEQVERKASYSRPSLSAPRSSGVGLGRPSINMTSVTNDVRYSVDAWLTDRERGDQAGPSVGRESQQHGRPSVQWRDSTVGSEHRLSTTLDEIDHAIDPSVVDDESLIIERCLQHINTFATEGLRTLLYGYRFIEDSEYSEWKELYQAATTSLVDRNTKIEEAGELIEVNLDLAGATAIEDKLQDGVPQTIDKLRRANIKLWMLTGDKRETAINIGQSCKLIKEFSTLFVIDRESGDVGQDLINALSSIESAETAHSVVVIDGQTLASIEADRNRHALFVELAVVVDAVICCRASPSQKSSLVHAIRKRLRNNAITLAIGDGANDIAMIQEAHVGIGITGKEGLQAARTSDYSIAQFRFLTKLLLVHGRWNYIRICKYTVGTFWKELLFYLTQALYQRSAGYTGTSLYESWSLSMFNTLFTSLPVIFMGIFEKDLAASTLLAVPELYTKGQRNAGFNYIVYASWMFMAASSSIIIWFCMYGLFGSAPFAVDHSLFAMGAMTFTACVVIISFKMQLFEMHNKSLTAALAMFLSIGGWFLWNIILAATYSKNTVYAVRDGLFDRFGRDALWWLVLILIVAAISVFEIAVLSLRTAFAPTDVDDFQALEKDPVIRRRFEEAAASELQAGWKKYPRESEASALLSFLQRHAPPFLAFLIPSPRHSSPVSSADQSGMLEQGVVNEMKQSSSAAKLTSSVNADGGGGGGKGKSVSRETSGQDSDKSATTMTTAEDAQRQSGNDVTRGDDEGAAAAATQRQQQSQQQNNRRSSDIHELLRKRFGAVQEE